MNAQEKGLPAPHSADCRVDFLDVKAAILNRLDGAGDLHQLACVLLWIGDRAISGVFIDSWFPS